tara:strand:- start:5 stop:289 length:285 start_codon:yes stop_codon:yes gene_type:complete
MNLKENMKRFGTKNLQEQTARMDIIANKIKTVDIEKAMDMLSVVPGFDIAIATQIMNDLRRGKFDEDTAKKMLMLVPIVGNVAKIQQIVKVLQD